MDETTKHLMEEKTKMHPCFTCGGCGGEEKMARIHLPVAPKCNIQCNYCVRKYDCMNESRPGVTSTILSPEQAAAKYLLVRQKIKNLTVVGIAGPGDALANWPEVKETLRLIREQDPYVTFCLSTNGLMLPLYAQEILDAGVTHVTITINAVDPEIGAQIYQYVDYMGRRYHGIAGASILMSNQLSGLKYLADRGAVVKVNCVVLKNVNEQHLGDVVKTVKELGGYMTNLMQLIPVEGSAFEHLGKVSMKEIDVFRKRYEPLLKQMYHCRQCRADAIGTLDNDQSIAFRVQDGKEEKTFYRLAVATKSGEIVDCHFGQADQFSIFESDGKAVRLIEKRDVVKYCSEDEENEHTEARILDIYRKISDCNGVLTMRIGEIPRRKLSEKGIQVVITYDKVEAAVRKAASSF